MMFRMLSGCFLACLVVFWGCNGKENAQSASEPSIKVQVITAQTVPHAGAESVPGTVRARDRAMIEAKVAGRIARMPFGEGQAFKKDDLLVELDVQEIKAKLDQATAMRDQAQRDLARFSALLQQKAATQAEYDGVEARARVARGAVDEAKAMLAYAEVRAPFSGVVTRKLANVGDLGAPGKPLLEIENPEFVRFEANIPETLISNIAVASSLPVELSGNTGDVPGIVAEIAPVADPNSRTYLAKLDLPPGKGIRSGQYGHVSVSALPTSMIILPREAVSRRGQMETVFIVQNGRAFLRLVRTGKSVAGGVEIVSGIEPGEAVAISEERPLKDGDRVENHQ